MAKTRIYVGRRKSDDKLEVFRSRVNPTQDTHGDTYKYTIGPFRTFQGADYMATYARHDNPHLRCVADAEYYAKLKSQSMSNVRVGTCYFVNQITAQRYYSDYEPKDTYRFVEQKLRDKEIHLGPPPIVPHQRYYVNDEGRYVIVEYNPSEEE